MSAQHKMPGRHSQSVLTSLGEGLKDYLKQTKADWRRSTASSPFERFTDRARQVLTLAQQEARRCNHHYIGTEHLLLGLVAEGEGVAAQALTNLGVELERVRAAVEHIVGRGDTVISGEIGLTPRTKNVFALAVDEARQLKHSYVGTEHLLLGLVREGEGIAAGVLTGLGVSLEAVRGEVLQILGSMAPRPKSTVVMCRLDDRALNALDILIEAGVRSTRSDAAAWLIQAGIEAHTPLFASVAATVGEIRRLRAEAQQAAQRVTACMPPPAAGAALPGENEGPPQTPPVSAAE